MCFTSLITMLLGCDYCYDEKQRETLFIKWNDEIRIARETVVERTKTERSIERSIDTACHFDEVNIARLVMEYLLKKSGASIVEIEGEEIWEHEAFIDFINTYKDDTLSHIPVRVSFTFHSSGYRTSLLTSLVKAMLSSAQNQSSLTFSLGEIRNWSSRTGICTDFLASEMLKATPASRAVFGALTTLDGLSDCGKLLFEAVQAGLAPNLTNLCCNEWRDGFTLIDEETDFQCLLKTIKSESCAFRKIEFELTCWNLERASLLIDSLRSPNCKLEEIYTNHTNIFKTHLNVDKMCLELSRLFGVPAE
jgi:hypothetical protein